MFKYIFLTALFSLTAYADILSAQAESEDKNSAITLAKKSAVQDYVARSRKEIPSCQHLVIEQEVDLDSLDIVQLEVSNLELTKTGYSLNVRFDIEAKDNDFKASLKEQCLHHIAQQNSAKRRQEFYNSFHYGVGLNITWGYGAEIFAEYRPSNEHSFYTLLSYTVPESEEDISMSSIGLEYRWNFLLIGLDYILDASYPSVLKEATLSYKIGVSLDPLFWKNSQSEPYELGFYFKSFNDQLSDNSNSVALVWYGRYKFD